MFYKKDFLENSTMFAGTIVGVSFLINSPAQVLSCESCKFSRTPILKYICERLFVYFRKVKKQFFEKWKSDKSKTLKSWKSRKSRKNYSNLCYFWVFNFAPQPNRKLGSVNLEKKFPRFSGFPRFPTFWPDLPMFKCWKIWPNFVSNNFLLRRSHSGLVYKQSFSILKIALEVSTFIFDGVLRK